MYLPEQVPKGKAEWYLGCDGEEEGILCSGVGRS